MAAIVLTGCSQGIGYETAVALCASSSNTVIGIARNEKGLQELALRFSNFKGIAFDLNQSDFSPLQKQILHHTQEVDVLINNAAYLINKSIENTSAQDWRDCYQSNVISPFKLIQVLLPHFSSPAHIVNIGSMGGFQGSKKFPGLSAYSASKAALHNLTECFAEELKSRNIAVNALALGSTQTAMLEKAFPGFTASSSAEESGRFIADFALNGHLSFNGKIIPFAKSTP